MPKKLILDVDTGTDDAVALMLAALHPDLELIAATTVNGNNPVVNCTDNTLRVFDLLGRCDPRLRGRGNADRARRLPCPAAPCIREKGSMHGLELPIPKPRSVKQSKRAVEFLVETYMAATEPIALVPVGPLTNIAMAIKTEPRIVERIPRDDHHGRRAQEWEHDASGRVQHLGRPGGGPCRVRSGFAERGGRAAGRDAPRARLARRLPADA